MNKSIKILFAFCLIGLLSSCSDVENEIWINKDGSGKIAIDYDMSSMLEMASMFEGMGEENGHKDEKDEPNKSDKNKAKGLGDIKSLDDIMDKLANPNSIDDIDTSFSAYSVMPDSIKNTIENPEAFKKINIAVLSDKSESLAKFGVTFEYDSSDEFHSIIKSLADLDKDNTSAEKSKAMDKFKGMITNYEADLKKGIVTIPSQDFSDGLMDESLTGGKSLDNMDEESMGMMQMLFGDASIVTKMHLPGEILSCDDPTADIFGDQIRFNDSFMDLVKNKKTKARVIKFKK